MKKKQFIPAWKFSNTVCFMILTVFLFGGLFTGQSYGGTAKEIDASADAAMDRFYKNVKDAKEVVRQSKGMLIMPNVKKGALIVGGEYGQGSLRIGGKTVGYYSMTSGSLGFQIGGESKDVIFAFMSSEALKKFRNSKGWEAGVDANVALITVGAGASAITAMGNEPIVAFVFDVKGLMADWSLRGAKFNKLDK
ncbi:MAG: lipid-binding SYLF domain-containing protein [Planctomycetota bacterium]|jgi:lipid-binding SYLF domain-containing protein